MFCNFVFFAYFVVNHRLIPAGSPPIMPNDKFRIRIRPDGTIYFFSQNLGEERMRQLRELIEDALGEIRETRIGDAEGIPPSVGIAKDDKQDQLRAKK